jgi:hypothetical protein
MNKVSNRKCVYITVNQVTMNKLHAGLFDYISNYSRT